MQLKYRFWMILLLLVLVLTWETGVAWAQDDSVVRMVYFYAYDCPHCIVIIDEVLTPLQAERGDRMQIKMVEISEPDNYELMIRAEEMFDVTAEERGLPTLIIDGQVFIGEDAIRVGTPRVEGASVVATIQGEASGPKLRIFKHKRRKRYRLHKGHRQHYTSVKIESIKV